MTLLAGKIIGANGDVVDCSATSTPFRMAENPGFFGATPVELNQLPVAGILSGTVAGRTRHGARPVRWSLLIDCDTPSELLAAIDRLAAAVNPVRTGTNEPALSRLVVTRPDGTSRVLAARYSGGLDGVDIAHGTTDIAQVDLIFRADEPHWLDAAATEVYVSFPVTGSGATAVGFNDAIPFNGASTPFNGFESSEEEGTSQATLQVDGTAEAWPTWTAAGDLNSIEVLNRRTGQAWRWAGNLDSGHILDVATSDRRPSVRVDGVDAGDGVPVGSDLFPLLPGDNPVVIRVTGATSTTALSVSWQNAHLTP